MKEKLYPHPFLVLGKPVTKAELDELLELEENREARYQDWYEDPESHM